MTGAQAAATPLSARTAWARNLQTPLREFLRTETGGAVVLLAATLAALAWANLHPSSYQSVWETPVSVRAGDIDLSQDLRLWINNGLMTLFFFVVGLEARREFDLGELRERRRLALPLAAGVGGLAVPAAIYLAANAGEPSVRGWGAAMSTDTAFALGMLALVGRRFPARLRAYLLTVTVVDDVIAIGVIATVYTEELAMPALLAALGIFGVILLVRARGLRGVMVYVLLGTAAWVALYASGVEPVVVGLAMGLLTYAYPAARSDLERATEVFRSFREQPTRSWRARR
jgi:Na+/H+ antiporter NhaA